VSAIINHLRGDDAVSSSARNRRDFPLCLIPPLVETLQRFSSPSAKFLFYLFIYWGALRCFLLKFRFRYVDV
jgi:hypothetical protein